MMMKLYGYWRSTAAYRVRIALAVKNIEVEAIEIHLVKDGGEQHQQDFRAINPQGLVPALEVNGNIITQSMAILDYLEEQYPKPSLLSDDAVIRAQIKAFAQTIVCDIHPLNNLRVLQYLKGNLAVSEEQKTDWYLHWVKLGFEALETIIAQSKIQQTFCFGEQPSMADICLIPQIYNANRFHCPMDNYPNLQRINSNCLQLEAFIAAIPENQPDAC